MANMRQKVFTLQIQGKEDMSLLESTIGGLLRGEHNKCALIRCNEFIQLRLCALYGKGIPPIHVYGEGLQRSLDASNVVSVYLLMSYVEADEGLLGKRSEPEKSGSLEAPAFSTAACLEPEKSGSLEAPAFSTAACLEPAFTSSEPETTPARSETDEAVCIKDDSP